MKKLLIPFALALPLCNASATDLSDDGTLVLTGFYNITGAKVLGGSAYDAVTSRIYDARKCPCSVAEIEYGSVYEKARGFSFDKESLVGIQIRKDILPTLSATAQLVSRAHNPNEGSKPTADWLYATWKPSIDSSWTLNFGKMRIPLFYYSDQRYIGYAYPWVRPTSNVYGTSIHSYNGFNASYRAPISSSDWTSNVTFWSGNYTDRDNVYRELIAGQPRNESYKRMLGGSLSVNNDVFDIRAVMMRMNYNAWQDQADGSVSTLAANEVSRFMGISMNVDYQNWLVNSELQKTSGALGHYQYGLFGVGYQFGAWTPMYTFSRYREVRVLDARSAQTISVRWDFAKNTALKLQYDMESDAARYSHPLFGDIKLLSISLQGIF